MCGRFNVSSGPLSHLLMQLVGMVHPGPDNLNLAPTETVQVLRLNDDGEPELVPMRWWLTPFWAKELSTKYSMFNAKAETAHKSAAFKEPFRKRRCVVPVHGFYEWSRSQTPHNSAGDKLPYFIVPEGHEGLLIAGLWDRWRNRESGEELLSFTVLTTSAAEGMQFLHHRQPVMLSLSEALQWMDMSVPTEALAELLAPRLPMGLEAVPVDLAVNNARNKDARCVAPSGPEISIAGEFGT